MASTKKIWVANNFNVDVSGLQSAKRQASSAKLRKEQAASVKPRGTSIKRQAASNKLPDL